MKDKIHKIRQLLNFTLSYIDDKNTKFSSNPEDILKSAKKILQKLNTKEDTSKTTIPEGLSKILKRKKISKQRLNFFESKISVELHGM